jgi:hypothetical protein
VHSFDFIKDDNALEARPAAGKLVDVLFFARRYRNSAQIGGLTASRRKPRERIRMFDLE